MKYVIFRQSGYCHMSPSMRREWIEMNDFKTYSIDELRLPPCGGSGLKCQIHYQLVKLLEVSLHAEGVD